MKLKVWDARYRMGTSWNDGTMNFVDTPLTNYTAIPTDKFDGGTAKLTTAAAKAITDTQLNALFAGSGKHDASTARQNTDVLVAQTQAHQAARHCRTLGADLPNIQELAIIYCEADFLDSMDPTVASYPDNKLSGWYIASAAYAWPSTEHDALNAWFVDRAGCCRYGLNKHSVLAVVPVQEMA